MDKLIAVGTNSQESDCCTTRTVTSWTGKFIAMLMLFLIVGFSAQATNCELIGVPGPSTVDCDNIPPPADVTAECEGCNGIVSLTEVVSDKECASRFTLTRIWTATDCAGNVSVKNEVITVVDDTPITMDPAPGDLVIECGDDIPAPATLTASGGCVQPFVRFRQRVNYDVQCPVVFEISRKWTAEDECGRIVVREQLITVRDTEAPVASNDPEDITIQCTDDIPGVPTVTFTDKCCDPETGYSSTTIPGDCPQEYTIVREWYAIDKCENETIITQTITVVDTTAPVIIPCEDQTVECMDNEEPGDIERGTVIPSPCYTVSDNCAADVIVDIDTNRVAYGCTYQIIYTFTASDSCGNQAVPVTQTITVIDTTAPTIFDVPADATYECDDDIPAQGDVMTYDACSDVRVVKSETRVEGDCPQEYQLIRYWTAYDECENSSEASQVITVVDTTAPVITIDPNTTVECLEDVVDPDYSVEDNCDENPDVDVTRTVIEGSGCQIIVQYTVTATDACGNSSTATHDVLVVDTTPPSIMFAGQLEGYEDGDTIIQECDDVTFYTIDDIKVEDNCCIDDTTFVETVLGDDGCTLKMLCEWTVYDCCGNDSTIALYVFITDTTPPTITVPDDSEHECDEIVPVGTATAEDNCDENPTVMYVGADTIPGECHGDFTVIRTWKATDDCDNMVTGTQTLTFTDNTPPVLTIPADFEAECDDLPDPADYQDEVSSDDNCCFAPVTLSIDSEEDECYGKILWIFTATDDCGNSTTDTTVIDVVDNTPPVLTIGPDSTIQCDAGFEGVPMEVPYTVTDNCDENVDIDIDTIRVPGNCPQEYIWRFTVTAVDDCGNEASGVWDLIVVDDEAPVLIGVPPCDTFECSEFELPAPVVTATDNCDDEVPVTMVRRRVEGDCVGEWTVWFIYTATDDCGNSTTDSTCYQFIDTTPPVILGVPDDIRIPCDQDYDEPTGVTAEDECCIPDLDGPVITTIPGRCPQEYTKVYAWKATDDCGNMSFDTFRVTKFDNEAPVIVGVPEDITLECDDRLPGLPIVTATDNCDDDVVPVFEVSVVPGDCPHTFVMTRTWTATDDCGNESVDSYTITVVDTTAPVIIPCEDQTVECMDNEEPGDIERGTVIPSPCYTVSDNCAADVIVDIDTNRVAYGCTYQIIYTFTASDSCGNQAVPVTQTITVIDTTAPTIFDVPADATYECDDDIPAQGDVMTYDACSDVRVVKSETRVEGDCPQEYQLIRYWTAYDECENSSEASQVITVVDTTAPVITIDPNTTVECLEDVVDPDYSVEDNCDENPDVDVTRTVIEGSGCQIIVQYTVTATDACGNSSTATHDVLVVDTTPPSIMFAGQLEGYEDGDTIIQECDDVTFYTIDDIKVEDNCCIDDTTFVETVLGDDGCTLKMLCEWTVYDCCGNDSTIALYVFITDTTPPTITVPDDSEHECDEIVPVGTATAEDNCDENPTVMYVGADTIPGECHGDFTVIRTWKATDDCDNMVTGTQTLTFTDNTPPVLTIPADFEAECDDLPDPADYQDEVSSDDNCCFAPVTLSIDSEEDECYGKILWIFTATDDCGNSTTDTTVIDVVDNTPPVLTIGPDSTIQCDAGFEGVPMEVPYTVTDNCDENVDIDIDTIRVPGNCPQEYIWRFTVTAVDDCGNEASGVWDLIVVDDEAPVLIGVPPCDTFECSEFELPAPVVTATDNCDDEVPVTMVRRRVEGDCVGEWTVWFIYTATDDCGNSTTDSTCYQFIDTTPPVILGVPDDIRIPCDQDYDEPTGVTAEDECCIPDLDGPVITTIPGRCPQEYTKVYAWKATDDCGNMSFDTFRVTKFDNEAPVIVGVPEDITLECDDRLPGLPIVTATDNCDDDVVPVFEVSVVPGDCPHTFVMTRTWTATDDCGNESVDSYTITVVDTTAPVIIPCEDQTVECMDNEEPGDIERGTVIPSPCYTVSDNCAADVIVDIDTNRVAYGCTYQIIYTFTASDSCGNQAVPVTQTITVIDTTAPTIFDVPADATYECDDDIPAQGDVMTYDACSDVRVVKSETRVEGDCPQEYQLIRYWTAYDECENSSEASQVITVVDTTAPVITIDPNTTVECLEDVVDPDYSVEDNCDENPDVDVTRTVIEGSGCQIIVQYTVTATDACGNSSTATHDVLVVDTTPPSIMFAGQLEGYEDGDTIIQECDDVTFYTIDDIKVEDNCCIDDTTFVETVLGDDGCTLKMLCEWTVYDCCGNDSTIALYVFITDTTPPTITVPDDSEHECDEIVPVGTATAEDNCDENPTVMYVGADTIPGECHGDFTVIRTWKATDDCDNMVTGTQTLTFTDNTPPVLTIPADFEAECDDLPDPADYQDEVSSDDNCCFAPVTLSIDSEEDECYGKILWIFTATDDCGNSTTDTTVIDVVDNTDPVLVNAADLIPVIEIGCNDPVPTFNPEWSDNCDEELEETAISSITPPGCLQIISRSWTATDDCGNSTTVSQTVRITDQEAPVLVGVPDEDLELECGEDHVVPTVTASDDCADISGEVEPLIAVIDGICINGFQYTWSVTDDCDNTTTKTWTVTYRDTQAPNLEVEILPSTVECLEDVTDPDFTASDDCSPFRTIVNKDIITGSGCEMIVTFSVTAIDTCGNDTTSAEQTVIVRDNTSPVYPDPTMSTEECGTDFEFPDAPEATDNCDDELDYDMSGPERVEVDDCEYHLVKTYTATDDCGNQATTTHTIKVVDTTPPTVSVPGYEDGQTVEVECDKFETPTADDADAFDACCLDDVTFVEVVTGQQGCTTFLDCIWTAIDCCGNESTFTIHMVVSDRTAPVIVCPDDIEVDAGCPIVVTWDPATATDNCQPT